ncbi:hypothetical protein BT69DRAFT_1284329 [Atractiella rhizophila]|nr:hypothetical protein BT69DRAFT_1284329 [Atractiella rhizophila]
MSAHDDVYELLFQVVHVGDENQLVGKTSVIEFPANKTVAALEKAIRQEFPQNLSTNEFDLWMMDPMLAIEEEEVVKTIRFPSERLKKLHPAFRLSKYWQEAPGDGHLHLLVQLRDPPLVLQHPTSKSRDRHIENAFGRVKNTLGQLFQLPGMPDAVTRAIGASLQSFFFRQGPATQGRIATAAELRHYHEVAAAHPFFGRFSDNKEPYFNWTYMMPVARELSRRRYGSDQISDFIANRKWSIHLYPYTAQTPATSESPAVPMRQYKYQPRSDFQIQRHGIPQVLVEVQSKASGEDRCRMLLQAGALVRVVNHAMRSDASNPYILIAYYITNALEAEQYLLCIGTDSKTVKYSEYRFDLRVREEAFKFLLELYNCSDVIDSNNSWINEKASKIKDSLNTFGQLPSFTSTSNKKRKTAHESDGNDDDGNDGGLLAVPQVQSYLTKLGYRLESPESRSSWIPWEDVSTSSVVAASASDGTPVIIKRACSPKEAQIHQFLAGISDVKNHTMNIREVLGFQDYTLVVLPHGTPLPSLSLNTSLAISLADQLVDGVGFMHSHGFVHLDLKPNNLVVVSNVLKIIDFGLSRKAGDETILKGYRGTRSWVAPELGTEDGPQRVFHPIPADLWAVGLIISRFFGSFLPPCHYLLLLAPELMSMNPQSRPRLDKLDRRPKKRVLESEFGWSNLGSENEGIESESLIRKRRHLIAC